MMCMDTVLSTLIPRPAYGSASGAIRREKKGEPVYLQYHQVFRLYCLDTLRLLTGSVTVTFP
jgi:hypothetical protein